MAITVPQLILIREACENANTKPITIAISAMREEELVAHVLNWRCTDDEAEEVYSRLRQLVPEKYPDVKSLTF